MTASARGPALCLLALWVGAPGAPGLPAQARSGTRGDSAAIADARAMVETMGGQALWRELGSVHFVHEWDLYNRGERYRENEILDLTGPRSFVTMESETYCRVRAYSPEHRYWNIVDGVFAWASDTALALALERAPFSIYRIARGVAANDPYYRVRHGPMPGMPDVTALEFHGPIDTALGWILLNRRKEPVVWATTQYSYAFGPLERYGNLWVPRWAITGGGRVRYEMISLTGRRATSDPRLFAPPPRHTPDSAAAGCGGAIAETRFRRRTPPPGPRARRSRHGARARVPVRAAPGGRRSRASCRRRP